MRITLYPPGIGIVILNARMVRPGDQGLKSRQVGMSACVGGSHSPLQWLGAFTSSLRIEAEVILLHASRPKTKFSLGGRSSTNSPSEHIRTTTGTTECPPVFNREKLNCAARNTEREGPMELEGGREAEIGCEDEVNEEMEKHTMFCSHIRPSQCVAVGSGSRGKVHIEASAVRDGSWSSTVKCCVSWQRA